ncbi:MAG TPA: DoxX family protein [Candidatus Paceibacterota bacterium]|nr:DoxX family protein [Candidatus Paceibacterota bacterium]
MQELNKNSAKWLSILRIVTGWMMFYAGITKVINPNWTAAGYLKGAKTFTGFYQWLSGEGLIGIVNFVNEWGLTLLGVSLILGIGVRLSSIFGAILMLLYYFPAAEFPFVEHGFIVDDHIIYASVFAFFAAVRAGRYYGLENWCSNLPICSKFPSLRSWLG